MSRVNILVEFNIHSLTDDYFIVGSSDTGSFTHKLGAGGELLVGDPAGFDEEVGARVRKVIPLGEKYGDFKIRFYAENALGIRSPYVELDKLITAPDISGTFRFNDVRVRNLTQIKPSAFKAITNVPTKATNVFEATTEFVGKDFVLDWDLRAPYGISGNARGIISEDNPFLSHFKVEFYDDDTFTNVIADPPPEGFPYDAPALSAYYNFGIALNKDDIESIMVAGARAIYIKITGYDAYYSVAQSAEHKFEAKIIVKNIKSELDGCYAELYGNKMQLSYVNKDPDFRGGSVVLKQYRSINGAAYEFEKDVRYTSELNTDSIEQEWSDGGDNKNLYKYILELNDGYGLCGYYAILANGKMSGTRFDVLDGTNGAKQPAGAWEAFLKIGRLDIVENGSAFDLSWTVVDSQGHIVDIQKDKDNATRFVLNSDDVGFIQGFTAQFECPTDYSVASVNATKNQIATIAADADGNNTSAQVFRLVKAPADTASKCILDWAAKWTLVDKPTGVTVPEYDLSADYNKGEFVKLTDGDDTWYFEALVDALQAVDAKSYPPITGLNDFTESDAWNFANVPLSSWDIKPAGLMRDMFDLDRIASLDASGDPLGVAQVGAPIDASGPVSTINQTDVPTADNGLSIQTATSFKLTKEQNADIYRSWLNGENPADRKTQSVSDDPFRVLYNQQVGDPVGTYKSAGEWAVDAQRKIKATISLVDSKGTIISTLTNEGHNKPPTFVSLDDQGAPEEERRFIDKGTPMQVEFILPASESIQTTRIYRRPHHKPDSALKELYVPRHNNAEKNYSSSVTEISKYNSRGATFFATDTSGASRNEDVMLYNMGVNDSDPPGEELGIEYGFFANRVDGAGNGINTPNVNGQELNKGELVTYVDMPPMLRKDGIAENTDYDYQLIPYDSFGSGHAWFVKDIQVKKPSTFSQDEDGAIGVLDFDAPEPPTDLKITGANKTFFLDWKASESTDVDSYNLIYINDSRSETERLESGTKITDGNTSHKLDFQLGAYDHNSSEFHKQDLDFESVLTDTDMSSAYGGVALWDVTATYVEGNYVKWRSGFPSSKKVYRLYRATKANGIAPNGDPPDSNGDWQAQSNVQVWSGGSIVYTEDLVEQDREADSPTYSLIYWDAGRTYVEDDIAFSPSTGKCYRSLPTWRLKTDHAVVITDGQYQLLDATTVQPLYEQIGSTNKALTDDDYWTEVVGVTIQEIGIPSFETSISVVADTNDKGYFFFESVDRTGNRSKLHANPSEEQGSGPDDEQYAFQLGKSKLKDVGNFEQELSEEFPNAVMLRPENPFIIENNDTIKWASHYLYNDGKGYFIKSGSIPLGDVKYTQNTRDATAGDVGAGAATTLGEDIVRHEVVAGQVQTAENSDQFIRYLYWDREYGYDTSTSLFTKSTDQGWRKISDGSIITQAAYGALTIPEKAEYEVAGTPIRDNADDPLGQHSGLEDKAADTEFNGVSYYSFCTGSPASHTYNVRDDWRLIGGTTTITQAAYNALPDTDQGGLWKGSYEKKRASNLTNIDDIVALLNTYDDDDPDEIIYSQEDLAPTTPGFGVYGIHIPKTDNLTTAGDSSLQRDGNFQIARVDYIDTNYTIKTNFEVFNNATIGQANISNATITSAQVADLKADKITAGVIGSHRIQIGNSLIPASSNGALVNEQLKQYIKLDPEADLLDPNLIDDATYTALTASKKALYVLYDPDSSNVTRVDSEYVYGSITSKGFGADTKGRPGFFISGDGQFGFQTTRGGLYLRDDGSDTPAELVLRGTLIQETADPFVKMEMNTSNQFLTFNEHAENHFYYDSNASTTAEDWEIYGTQADIVRPTDGKITIKYSIQNARHVDGMPYTDDQLKFEMFANGDETQMLDVEDVLKRYCQSPADVRFKNSTGPASYPGYITPDTYAGYNPTEQTYYDAVVEDGILNIAGLHDVDDINKGGTMVIDFLGGVGDEKLKDDATDLILFTGAPIEDADPNAYDPSDPYDVIKKRLEDEDITDETTPAKIYPIADSYTIRLKLVAKLDAWIATRTYLAGDLVTSSGDPSIGIETFRAVKVSTGETPHDGTDLNDAFWKYVDVAHSSEVVLEQKTITISRKDQPTNLASMSLVPDTATIIKNSNSESTIIVRPKLKYGTDIFDFTDLPSDDWMETMRQQLAIYQKYPSKEAVATAQNAGTYYRTSEGLSTNSDFKISADKTNIINGKAEYILVDRRFADAGGTAVTFPEYIAEADGGTDPADTAGWNTLTGSPAGDAAKPSFGSFRVLDAVELLDLLDGKAVAVMDIGAEERFITRPLLGKNSSDTSLGYRLQELDTTLSAKLKFNIPVSVGDGQNLLEKPIKIKIFTLAGEYVRQDDIKIFEDENIGAADIVAGGTYIITSLGTTTNWGSLGAGASAAVGETFVALADGDGAYDGSVERCLCSWSGYSAGSTRTIVKFVLPAWRLITDDSEIVLANIYAPMPQAEKDLYEPVPNGVGSGRVVFEVDKREHVSEIEIKSEFIKTLDSTIEIDALGQADLLDVSDLLWTDRILDEGLEVISSKESIYINTSIPAYDSFRLSLLKPFISYHQFMPVGDDGDKDSLKAHLDRAENIVPIQLFMGKDNVTDEVSLPQTAAPDETIGITMVPSFGYIVDSKFLNEPTGTGAAHGKCYPADSASKTAARAKINHLKSTVAESDGLDDPYFKFGKHASSLNGDSVWQFLDPASDQASATYFDTKFESYDSSNPNTAVGVDENYDYLYYIPVDSVTAKLNSQGDGKLQIKATYERKRQPTLQGADMDGTGSESRTLDFVDTESLKVIKITDLTGNSFVVIDNQNTELPITYDGLLETAVDSNTLRTTIRGFIGEDEVGVVPDKIKVGSHEFSRDPDELNFIQFKATADETLAHGDAVTLMYGADLGSYDVSGGQTAGVDQGSKVANDTANAAITFREKTGSGSTSVRIIKLSQPEADEKPSAGYKLAYYELDGTTLKGWSKLPKEYSHGMFELIVPSNANWPESVDGNKHAKIENSASSPSYIEQTVHYSSGEYFDSALGLMAPSPSTNLYFGKNPSATNNTWLNAHFAVKLNFKFYHTNNFWKAPDGNSSETFRTFSARRSGHHGSTPTYRGPWKTDRTYFGDLNRRDIVHHKPAGGESRFWIAREGGTQKALGGTATQSEIEAGFSGTTNGGEPSASSEVWEPFGAQFKSVATNLLLADDVFVKHGVVVGIDDVEDGFLASQIDEKFFDPAFGGVLYGRSSDVSGYARVHKARAHYDDGMVDATSTDMSHITSVTVSSGATPQKLGTYVKKDDINDIITTDAWDLLPSVEPDPFDDWQGLYEEHRVTTWKIPFTDVPGFFLGYHDARFTPRATSDYISSMTGNKIPMLELRSPLGNFFRWDGLRIEMYGSIINGSINDSGIDVRIGLGGAADCTFSKEIYNGQIFVGGGFGNYVPDNPAYLGSAVVGGGHNRIFKKLSFIGGGYGNTVASEFSFIGCGYGNLIGGSGDDNGDEESIAVPIGNSFNAIVTGRGNKIFRSKFAFIGSGFDNCIDGSMYSSILNGQSNAITKGSEYNPSDPGTGGGAALPQEMQDGSVLGSSPESGNGKYHEFNYNKYLSGISIFNNCSEYINPVSGETGIDGRRAWFVNGATMLWKAPATAGNNGKSDYSDLIIIRKSDGIYFVTNQREVGSEFNLATGIKTGDLDNLKGEWINIQQNTGPWVWQYKQSKWYVWRLGESNRLETVTKDVVTAAAGDTAGGLEEVDFTAYELHTGASNDAYSTNRSGTPASLDDGLELLDYVDLGSCHGTFGYNTVVGGRLNAINYSSNSVVLGSSNTLVSNMKNAVVGGLANRVIGKPATDANNLTKGATVFGAGNIYNVNNAASHSGSSPTIPSNVGTDLASSILGSDNTIFGCKRAVVLGSNNQIKGSDARMSGSSINTNYQQIEGSEVNILGTNNKIVRTNANVQNLAIFGSNFVLTAQDQMINAYYIGNPFPTSQEGILSRLFVAADGGAYFTGDVISFALSDKKHKGNVATIENPLDKIAKIRGITFEWKDTQKVYSGKDIGVLAQEIEKVLPEVVEDRMVGKGVKYEKITPLLIEGIKAQQELIDSLTKRVSDLESAINKLQ